MFQYSELLVMLSGLICMIMHTKLSFSAHASVLEWYSGMYVHVPVLLWAGLSFFFFHWMPCSDRKRREWVVGLWSWWLCSFAGRHGFAWAMLTAKKQVVPSPATASTEVHRSTQKSTLLIPLFPPSKQTISELCEAIEAFQRKRARGRKDCVKEERERKDGKRGGRLRGGLGREKETVFRQSDGGIEFKTGRGKMSYYSLQPVPPSH